MKTLPDDLDCFEDSYSNFDHAEPAGAEDAAKAGKIYVEHTAWDHWGAIWFEGGKFYEQVMRYGAHIATVEGDSLRDVFESVNERFGSG